MSNHLLSVNEVAEILGLHVRTVRAYVRDGKLPAVKIGKQYRIAMRDVEKLLGSSVAESVPATTPTEAEVSAVAEIKPISSIDMSRISTVVTGMSPVARAIKIETIYDPQRETLKIILIGPPTIVAETLLTIDEMVAAFESEKSLPATRRNHAADHPTNRRHPDPHL